MHVNYRLKVKIPLFITALVCFLIFGAASITMHVFLEDPGVLGDPHKTVQILKAITFLLLAIVTLSGASVARGVRKPFLTILQGFRKQQTTAADIKKIVTDNGNEFNVMIDFCNRLSLALKGKMEELQKSYEEVEQTRSYLMNILSSAPSAIFVSNSSKTITLCNRALEEITGYKEEEIIGTTLRDFLLLIKIIFAPGTLNPVNKAGVPYVEREAKITRKDGTSIPVAVVTADILNSEAKRTGGNIFFLRDLTFIKRLEEDLARDDQLRIMGEMSASIIHEIGNPLAGMGNLLEALGDEMKEQGFKSNLITFLQEEIGRLNNLVLSLLDFTHKTVPEKEQINLEQLVESVIRLLGGEVTEKRIRIKREYPKNPPLLIGEPQKLKQALLNVMKNAVQAVDSGGIISIRIELVNSQEILTREPRTYLVITVRDNGVGIPQADINRIFDPFYSSKTRGTGLGLTITQKIVKEHGGYIEVRSVPREFTDFILYLPFDSEQEMKEWEGIH